MGEQLRTMSEELQRDEKALEQKIKKKRQELDRCRKRLTSLANVRPAFMDEYEQLEQALESYYEQYVGRFRNLDYLEHEIDTLNREETDKMEENERALKRMQKRLRDAEWAMLRGEHDEKDGKKPGKSKDFGRKGWAPPGGNDTLNDETCDEDFVSSAASGSDDDSTGGDESIIDSGDEVGAPAAPGGGGGIGDHNMSIGGSVSDDDIMNESEEEDFSEEIPRGVGGRGGNVSDDFDF